MCVCVGGGDYSHLSFIYRSPREELCGLVALADTCRGKKDHSYLYPPSPRVFHYNIIDMYVHNYWFIRRHAQYLLSYISGFVTKLMCIKVEMVLKYNAARERLNRMA